jgi:hypothetical protein
MFSKIVMASRCSETSTLAVRCLRGLRRLGAEQAILVHALNIRDVGGL